MLAHRLRCWPNIEPTLGKRLAFAGDIFAHIIVSALCKPDHFLSIEVLGQPLVNPYTISSIRPVNVRRQPDVDKTSTDDRVDRTLFPLCEWRTVFCIDDNS